MKTASNTNRTEMVKALKELEAKAAGSEAPDEIWCEYSQNLREAAPWLLQIAEAFQPGDSVILRTAASLLVAHGVHNESAMADCLRRLQAACEEMER